MRLLLLFFLTTLALNASDKVALVIGNKNYTNHTGLKNPISDARLIRDTLKGMNFEVIEAYDANIKMLDSKIGLFSQKAYQAKVAVVYYAGHGVGVYGKNYLIPIGASGLTVDNLGRKLITVNELKGAVANAKGFGVVMFDACRNSFFTDQIQGLTLSKDGASRALTQPSVRRANVLVSFSTQAGTIAKDDVNNGNHSPYAMALSENLQANRDIRQVMGSIRERVYSLTSNTQYPVDKNLLGGKQYCLTGYCQSQGSDAENERLRAKIAMLERQQNRVVTPPVVIADPIETHNTDGITKIGNLMYQNQPFTKGYTWEEAKGYCGGLTLGGYSDWRLPTRAELMKLGNIKLYNYDNYDNWKKWFDKNKQRRYKNSKNHYHFIKKEFIENMPEVSWFWTSESKDSSYAWFVHFRSGFGHWFYKTNPYDALCVR